MYESCYSWADTVKTAVPLILPPPAISFPLSLFHHYLFLSTIHVHPLLLVKRCHMRLHQICNVTVLWTRLNNLGLWRQVPMQALRSLKIKIGDARETQLRRRREILSQKICWKTVLLQSAKSMLWLVKSGMKSQKTWKFRLIFATIFLLIRASFSCLLCFQSSPSRAQSLYSSQRALTPLTAPLQSRWSQRAF